VGPLRGVLGPFQKTSSGVFAQSAVSVTNRPRTPMLRDQQMICDTNDDSRDGSWWRPCGIVRECHCSPIYPTRPGSVPSAQKVKDHDGALVADEPLTEEEENMVDLSSSVTCPRNDGQPFMQIMVPCHATWQVCRRRRQPCADFLVTRMHPRPHSRESFRRGHGLRSCGRPGSWRPVWMSERLMLRGYRKNGVSV
jgi:hypothetical protein